MIITDPLTHYDPPSGLSIGGDALLSLSLLSEAMWTGHVNPGVNHLISQLECGAPCPPGLARALNDLARLALEAGPLLTITQADALIGQGLQDARPLLDLTPWLLNLAALGDGADQRRAHRGWETRAYSGMRLPARLNTGAGAFTGAADRIWRELTGLQRPPADPLLGLPRPAAQLYAQVALARAGQVIPPASVGQHRPLTNLLPLAQSLGEFGPARDHALITLQALAAGE